MKTVSVSIEVLNSIMNVLGQMPYVQVNGLLSDIQKDIALNNPGAQAAQDEEQDNGE